MREGRLRRVKQRWRRWKRSGERSLRNQRLKQTWPEAGLGVSPRPTSERKQTEPEARLPTRNQHLNGSRRGLRPGSLSTQNQHLNGHRRSPRPGSELNDRQLAMPLLTHPASHPVHPLPHVGLPPLAEVWGWATRRWRWTPHTLHTLHHATRGPISSSLPPPRVWGSVEREGRLTWRGTGSKPVCSKGAR